MAKFIALWGHPEDEPGFEKHYREVHLPLCEKWPGVQSMTTTKISATAMGDESPYLLVFEATFSSESALRDALTSPEMRAAGKDAMGIAKQYGARPTMLIGGDL
ncbi:MAG TPA: EthD family reductase [Actinomycetota bacterium]|nr:EthD family reductase [Actinomycetota bacterium]